MANHPARRAKIWSAIPGISLALTASGTSLGGSISFATADTVLRWKRTADDPPSRATDTQALPPDPEPKQTQQRKHRS